MRYFILVLDDASALRALQKLLKDCPQLECIAFIHEIRGGEFSLYPTIINKHAEVQVEAASAASDAATAKVFTSDESPSQVNKHDEVRVEHASVCMGSLVLEQSASSVGNGEAYNTSIRNKSQGKESVIEIKRNTITKGKLSGATNYYISSSNETPGKLMNSIRCHWKIESMHWTMDVVFKEDNSSKHNGNIPANMAIIRRFVLNILGQMKQDKETKLMLMYMIGWSEDYLHKFIQKLAKGS